MEWEAGKVLSEQDILALQRYSGFGGIKAIHYPYSVTEEWQQMGATKADLKLYEDLMQFHEYLERRFSPVEYRNFISSLKDSTLTAFYTPEFVPQVITSVLKRFQINPKRLYEPSAGSGVFIRQAVANFDSLSHVTSVEKDLLTARVLQALNSNYNIPVSTHAMGFEEAPIDDNGKYDLLMSNMPFGNYSVFDAAYPSKDYSGKIHNYFFVKGLDKLADGGLMAYITTDAFLNSRSNYEVRKYLFEQANFVALTVLPDNLMKETGNTEAPNHLLIVQKNLQKTRLSVVEEKLLETVGLQNEYGSYNKNLYINEHPEIVLGTSITAGKNQYGNAHETVWQDGDISGLSESLSQSLALQIIDRIDRSLFNSAQVNMLSTHVGQQLTYMPLPEIKQSAPGLQLGLFDAAPAETVSKVSAYLSSKDKDVVDLSSARIINYIRTKDNPAHESIVCITAKAKSNKQYIYKLVSNVKEITLPSAWLKADGLKAEQQKLADNLAHFEHEFVTDVTAPFAIQFPQNLPVLQDLPSFYKPGTLYIHEGKIGTVADNPKSGAKPVFIADANQPSNTDFYKQYIGIRDRFLTLQNQYSTDNSDNDLRASLNHAYDELVKSVGLLNFPGNRRKVLKDEAFGAVVLASLERRHGNSFEKSDILTGQLNAPLQQFRSDNPVEALASSLNLKNKVDLEYIRLVTNLTDVQVLEQLKFHIYLNPESREWITADDYLSGNVVAKLEAAKRIAEASPEDVHLQESLKAISEVQPEKIPFELLDFNLGERWVPTRLYDEFATELFECPVSIVYLRSVDIFKVSISRTQAKVSSEFAVTCKNGSKVYGDTLLEHALENTSPYFTYEEQVGDKKVRLPDNDAIQLAHEKIETIRQSYIEWLSNIPTQKRQELADLYNDTFNCYVLREYNGSHLTFPGLDLAALGIQELRESQRNACWRIIQNRGALIDHEVGLGKTLLQIITAHEMKRLDIVEKPAILSLKANVTEIADTYRKAYPSDRILAPTEEDFTPKNRQRLFLEIKNNNWDCIIMTHDQFEKIPQSLEIQVKIFNAELDNVERDLETVKDLGGEISKKMLKGLQTRQNNLVAKLRTAKHNIENKQDKGITFQQTAIDHLFVDESHKFKNLTFTTRHSRVAGLGNIEGSQKALNMLFAVRTLQEKFNADLCVTFLSGTPISNSLTEMYLIFKYLRPKEMERQGIENFDGWAAVFAKKTTEFEFSVTNEIIAKERFRHFIKVPELALFYNEITDYKTAVHIQLDKPGLNEILLDIQPTPEQSAFILKLIEFARTGNGELIGRGRLSPEEDKGRMLIATNVAKKMALDMRLVSESRYRDHPENKVSVCCRKVAELYRQTNEHKGTQLIFSDLGTPKPYGFNVYDAIREKLVREYNIPSGEIAFIHEWPAKKKPEFFKKMNKGEIRVTIGSTEKLGTGNNVQKRIVAMHHLDIPWRPSDLEQRDGRGARPGNILAKQIMDNKVLNYIYATVQSLDTYKFTLLKNKQTFISQMKNCKLNVRSIDEGALDEKSGMNFAEYIAILSGDTTLLEKAKLDKKIAAVESLKHAYYREISRTKTDISWKQNELKSSQETVEKLSKDYSLYSENLMHDKDGTKSNPLTIHGLKSSDPEIIGKHIQQLEATLLPAGPDKEIGLLYGFRLFVSARSSRIGENGRIIDRAHNYFYTQGPGDIKYSFNDGTPNMENPKLAARHFINSLDRIERLLEKYDNKILELKSEIPQLEILITKPFEREAELAEMKQAVSKMEREIALAIKEKQAVQTGAINPEAIAAEQTEKAVKPTLSIAENVTAEHQSISKKKKSLSI
ncbi:Eco57I restriction-modification methylase domain-containing protein [Mucilaginibacter defluvii]|uniref:Eco57I restriction-modification methylase domain-containing protein n=1 Tax=Mucilaginibacter defluvii TaxID=1196019 RepID=UPI0031EAC02E